MDYEDFKEQFVQGVKDRLADEGMDVKISVNEVKKLNESYEALTVTPEGSKVGVNIPIEKCYEAMDDGRSFTEVMDKAVEMAVNGLDDSPQINMAELTDYSKVKEKLAMEVVSAEANSEMLETVPHRNIEDMAVVYRIMLDSFDDRTASVLITNNLMDSLGVTAEQLHADAMENAPLIRPLQIKGMSEIMAEMMGVDQAMMMGVFPVEPEEEQMYVATVPDKLHGAGVLAYQDFMEKAAERAGGDFFILPSSIHELLIVPDTGEMDLKGLESMVREINATQVLPADKLTDNVYHYDSKEKIFELGEKFVERQNQREETAEKEEKPSILDELKVKKEEASKTPRKAAEKGEKDERGI
ncbi:MAG: DUF5688 family protein [Lachnospiraceae bacterium]|nr:DUF5688 family protein [Lachnospiraceae bacterium]